MSPVQPSLTAPQRWLLIFVAAVVLFTGMALIAEHRLKGVLLSTIAARTGRQVRIEGPLEIRLLALHPRLKAQKVSIGNPPWMPRGVTADIGTVSIALQWQFSLPPFSVRRLELNEARLYLARESSGRANWHLHEGGPGEGPPLIRSLFMPDAHVELHDERRHLEFHGRVTAGDLNDGTAAPPLRIAGAGELNGRPASFAIDGEPLALVRRDAAYHFTLAEQSGGNRLVGRGFLERPFDFRVLQGTFAISGPDLQDVYYLIGLRLPETGPYHFAGTLVRHNKRFEYHDLAVTSGHSDVSGTLTVDSSGGRPRIEGELTARLLRLADLGARAAGRALEQRPAAALRVPTTPLRVSGLQHTDWNVKLQALRLEVGAETLQHLTAHLSIDHGTLRIQKFNASLAEGSLDGSAGLDAEASPARAELDATAADIRLEQLTRHEHRAPAISGTLNVRVRLAGEGNSLHEMLATANGTVSAAIFSGAMQTKIAEAASLDLAGALGILAKSDKQTSVRCGVANFEAHNGVLSARTLVVDTESALITGSGAIHMDSETFDLTLRGRPKHAGLTLHSTVLIRGNLTHPEVRLNAAKVLAQGAAAAALGVVLTPVAAVLAFINPGLAHNADCAALTAEAGVPMNTARHDMPAARQ
jgi:AsmA family protein